MTRFALLLGLLGFATPWGARAHDIGVSEARLVETTPGRYQLSVQTSPSASSAFGTPRLPQRCTLVGSPRGAQGTEWKVFEIACEGGLRPDDVLTLPWRRDGVMLTASWAEGSEVRKLFDSRAGVIQVAMSELRIGSGSWQAAAKRYTKLGIQHILEGYDHLLFVFALLLVVLDAWTLVKTITAFTVAHSLTLGLATLGFVHVPSRPVEAAIALSIAFLAAEIIHARHGRPGLTHRAPWVVAFGFGLLHGFGFAGALSEIGLPQSEIPLALLFFNVGVEIGQLVFVVVVVALAQLVRQLPWASTKASRAIPAYAIGTLSMYWLLARLAPMVGGGG